MDGEKLKYLIGANIAAYRKSSGLTQAGLARMNVLSFIGFTTLGSALWNLFLMGIGYYLAALLPPDQIAARLVEYSNWVTFGFIGAIAAAVVWHYAKRYVERRRRR